MISISSALPAVTARAGSASPSATSASGKGKHAFASMFGKNALKTNASSQTTANADPIAQLTSLLQNGTPMATIVDQLSQSIGSSAAQLLAGKYSSGDLDRLRNTITQTIANALSPPSNAPPGTAAEEAAALAARLQRLVESLARDTQNGVGQQNEFSGNLLDANSAKEIPAQQRDNGTSSTLDASAIARSLLSSVVAALGASTSSAQTSAIAQQSAAPGSNAQMGASLTAATGMPSPSISMSNAPDLLARMLVRAAGADAQINGASAAASNADTAGSPSLSPSALAARFAALLAQGDAGSAITGSSSSNASTGGNSGRAFDQNLGQTPGNATIGIASPPASSNLFSQVQSALQNGQGQTTTVDANSVIEQMVSSMAMRTAQQGTSEIRLQLQPENLGQVTMRLTVQGSQVNASVVAQSADVRSALVANHQELARSLSEAGLTLSGFSVDVSGGDAGNDQGKDRTAGFGRRYTVHELASGDATSETADASSLGPQILSDSKLELFNYLA
jgi:flagellar hook-length control protein FliK